MTILNDIKKYKGVDDLVHLRTKNSSVLLSENGALFTVEYIISLFKQPDILISDKYEELYQVKLALSALEKFPGITIRSPAWDNRYDSMDNMGALLVFSALYDNSNFAKRMKAAGETVECVGVDLNAKLSKGHQHHIEENKKYYLLASIISTVQLKAFFKPKYFWNNRTPNLFCFSGWFGRSPGFLGLIDIAAERKTSTFRMLSLLAGQMLDYGALTYLNWQLLKQINFIWKAFYFLWYRILKIKHPNGMKDVYSTSRGINHPLTTYCRE